MKHASYGGKGSGGNAGRTTKHPGSNKQVTATGGNVRGVTMRKKKFGSTKTC